MWTEMKQWRISGVLAAVIAMCVLCTGCWITRNWRDYVPIAGVPLQRGVKAYSGMFVPRISGKHALLLRVKNGDWPSGKPINLRFQGTVKLRHGGEEKEHQFSQFIKTSFISDCVLPFYISNGIYMEKAEDSEDDYGCFSVTVEGDLDGFLSRNPETYITVNFIESK